jgi:hypothetical protein
MLGLPEARKLSFAEEGECFHFAYGAERARMTHRGDVSRFLFGTLENPDPCALPADHSVVRAMHPALPIPALWYGISYV